MSSTKRKITSVLAAVPLAGFIMLAGTAPSHAISCPPGHVSVDLGAMGEACVPAHEGNSGSGGTDYGAGPGSGPGTVTGPPQNNDTSYGPVPGYTPNIPAQPAAPVQPAPQNYSQNPAPAAPNAQAPVTQQAWTPEPGYVIESPQVAIEPPVGVVNEEPPTNVEPEASENVDEPVAVEAPEKDESSTKKMTKLEKTSEPEDAVDSKDERDHSVFWAAAAGAVTLFILVIAYARHFGGDRNSDETLEGNPEEEKTE